jgi:hypothetical protein
MRENMPELGTNTHIIPVRVDPTPYADDPVDAPAYYRALGIFLVAWVDLKATSFQRFSPSQPSSGIRPKHTNCRERGASEPIIGAKHSRRFLNSDRSGKRLMR